MNYTIKVEFRGGVVHIHPEYLKASPGDSVTWLIEPEAARVREVQVLFDKVWESSNGTPVGDPDDCNPMGPFRNLSLGAGLIVGTVHSNPYGGNAARPRLFFYYLFGQGKELTLEKPFHGQSNKGGIEIPMTPPAEADI